MLPNGLQGLVGVDGARHGGRHQVADFLVGFDQRLDHAVERRGQPLELLQRQAVRVDFLKVGHHVLDPAANARFRLGQVLAGGLELFELEPGRLSAKLPGFRRHEGRRVGAEASTRAAILGRAAPMC